MSPKARKKVAKAAKKVANKKTAGKKKVVAKAARKPVAKKIIKKASAPRRAAARPAAPPEPRYHTVTAYLNVRGASRAIEFLTSAFGARERLRMPGPDGQIMHAEVTIGDSTVMLAEAQRDLETRSMLHLSVPDCDAFYESALAAGAVAKTPPADMFWGDRFGQVVDPFGNSWAITTHKEDVSPEELQRRMAALPPPVVAPPPVV